MAFIDELIGQGGLPYGMEIEEEPKAHDEIDSLIDDDLQNLSTIRATEICEEVRDLFDWRKD